MRPRIKVDPRIDKIVKNNMSTRKKGGNPRWVNGVSGNPNGRPAGSRNKFSVAQHKALLAEGREMPLPFMLYLMRDKTQEMELRLEAAKAAAVYCHKKQPIGIEQMPGRYGSLTASQLRQLPTPALQQLMVASQAFYHQLVQLGVAQPGGEVIDVNPT